MSRDNPAKFREGGIAGELGITIGLLVSAVAIAVLGGWWLDVPLLKSVLPNNVTMKPNTALAFLAAGLAFSVPADWARGNARRALAGMVVLIGAATSFEYATSINLGIDELLFAGEPDPVATVAPGRMSVFSAVSFMLLGSVLMFPTLTKPGLTRISNYFALSVLVLAVISTLEHLHNLGISKLLDWNSGMALHTGLLFLLMSTAWLSTNLDNVVGIALQQNSPGRKLVLKILPIVFVLPAVVALAQVHERVSEMIAVGIVLLLIAIIFTTANELNRIDSSLSASMTKLDESIHRFDTTMYNLPIGMGIASLDGSWLQVNNALCELIGYTKAEMLTMTLGDITHPPDLRISDENFQQLARNSKTSFQTELRMVGKKRRRFWVQVNASTVRDDNAKLLYFIVQVQDFRAMKRAESAIRKIRKQARQLRQLNQELEAFSYSVSHDLRAPLRAIDGFSQLLIEHENDALSQRGRDRLARVRAATLRMGEIIDALLELSRVSRHKTDFVELDFSKLAIETAETVKAGNQNRVIDFVVAPGLKVFGDGRLLGTLMLNLFSNAWKFTRDIDQPRIEFGVTTQDAAKVFYLRDNGAGFDPKFSANLFQPFQRFHLRSEFEGHGIGLATVKRIIAVHGGRIWAESQPGEGATFYFTLMGKPADAEQPADSRITG